MGITATTEASPPSSRDAEPADVLYVGDEHEIDVVGARSAGLHAVLLDRTGDGPPAETSVIRSLAELPPLLR